MLLFFVNPFKEIFFPADNTCSIKFQSGSKNKQDILAGNLVIYVSTIKWIHLDNLVNPIIWKKFRTQRGDGNVFIGG